MIPNKYDMQKEIKDLINNKIYSEINYDTIGSTGYSSSKKILMPIDKRYNLKSNVNKKFKI